MLGCLANIFCTPTTPSAVIVIGEFGRWIDVIHMLPEDGSIEIYGSNHRSHTFHRGPNTEKRREYIGEATLDPYKLEEVLHDIQTRIRELWDDSMSLSPAQLQTGGIDIVAPLVENVLRPAALGAIRGREGEKPSEKGTRHSIYIIYIKRSRPRLVPDNFTSFPWSQ